MESIKLETIGKKHTKSLDTLIPDIYKLLANVSENKKVKVTDKQLNKFLNNITETVKDFTNPIKRDKKKLRMSSIGKPTRQLWYDKNNPPQKSEPDPVLQLKFLYGHFIEHLILFLADLSGHEVSDEQKKVDVYGVVGHMDSKIDGEVVDVKTASAYSFKKFKEGTLYGDDPFGYIAQLSGYEENEPTSKGGFLAINKSSGELALFRPDDLMKPNVKHLISEVKDKLSKDEPPERCYQPIPHEKGGNMKLPIGCFYCHHKIECHSDANEGKGLRIFNYAKSKVYLTKVVKEPKVEETIL